MQTWSAIAATGTADDGSLNLLSYSDYGSAFIRNGIASATAQIRFPVLPVGDLAKTLELPDRFCLGMSWRDTGANSRVVVSLKSVNIWTGEVVTYGTLDSDTLAQTGSAYETIILCNRLRNPDGTQMNSFYTGGAAYYVDAQLIKGGSDGNPGLKTVIVIPSYTQQ